MKIAGKYANMLLASRLSRSLKVIRMDTDRSDTYEFHSNHELISYRFRDTRRFLWKLSKTSDVFGHSFKRSTGIRQTDRRKWQNNIAMCMLALAGARYTATSQARANRLNVSRFLCDDTERVSGMFTDPRHLGLPRAGERESFIMRPSSLGGGRILRRTLSVRPSVRPSRYRCHR